MHREGGFCTLQLLLVEVGLEASLETVRITQKRIISQLFHYPL